jgi:peptidoglycan/xylan/chitin deacetylase (PgdA/CDA1 family)
MQRHQKLIQALADLANDTHLIDLYEKANGKSLKDRVRILLYHRIAPVVLPWSQSYVIHPSLFQWQLEYIKRNYRVVDLESVISNLLENRPLPARSVVLTIDDGYKDTYNYTLPLLKKFGIPATLFLNTEHLQTDRMYWFDELSYRLWHSRPKAFEIEGLGIFSLKDDPQDRIVIMKKINNYLREKPLKTRNSILARIQELTGIEIPVEFSRDVMLNWNSVKEMIKGGIKIGSHAISHSILSAISAPAMITEIVESKRILEDGLQVDVKFFAYPNGRYNDNIIEAVKAAGYQAAFTTFPKLVSLKAHQFELGRILPGIDKKTFRLFISGLFSDIYEVFNFIKRPKKKLKRLKNQF